MSRRYARLLTPARQLLIGGVCGAVLTNIGCTGVTDAEAQGRLHISATRLVLRLGDTASLGVTLDHGNTVRNTAPTGREPNWDAGIAITWSSSDPAVAAVDARGVVTARGVGRTVVTVRAAGLLDTGTVVVLQDRGSSPRFASVGVGSEHSCGLTVDGAAYCWGSAWLGQTGTGAMRQFTSLVAPAPVGGGQRFTALSVGTLHSCALDADGVAYCWGDNAFGQLGDGTQSGRPSPVRTTGRPLLRQIAAGGDHTCGLTAHGRVTCWGHGLVEEPVGVPGDSVVAITAGENHHCALTARHAAYCWGDNTYGQLGTSDFTSRAAPVAVAGGLSFASISAGTFYTCGVTTDGTAYCWGYGLWGRLGTGTQATTPTPSRVLGTVAFASIEAGGGHTCGVATDGRAFCWGRNITGELGDGVSAIANPTTSDLLRLAPTAVAGSVQYLAISAGAGSVSCGVAADGQLYCWGTNGAGAVGTGRQSAAPGVRYSRYDTPTPVAPLVSP
jgi:alpha-tubulin suppressor-like RCC1 family protein